MIPVYLEKLIHEGRAQFKTCTLGGTQACSFSIPDNNYIVITDLYYNHFIDKFETLITPGVAFEGIVRRSVHQLKIGCKGKGWFYLIKEPLTSYTDPGGASLRPQANGMLHFESYIVAEERVTCEVSRALLMDISVNPVFILYAPAPDFFDYTPGGSRGLNTLNHMNRLVLPYQFYIDLNDFNTPQNTGVGVPYSWISEVLRWPIVSETLLEIQNGLGLISANVDFWRKVPLITMNYIQVFEKKPANLKI